MTKYHRLNGLKNRNISQYLSCFEFYLCNVWGECSAYLFNRYINCVFVWMYQKMRQWEMWVGGSMPQFPLLAAGWPEVYSRYFTDGPCGIKPHSPTMVSGPLFLTLLPSLSHVSYFLTLLLVSDLKIHHQDQSQGAYHLYFLPGVLQLQAAHSSL